jgi:hypothetical protein
MRVKWELAACGVGDGLGVRSLLTGMSPAEGVEELDGKVGEAEVGEGGELSIGKSEVEGRLPRRGRPDGTILLQIGRRRPPPYWCAGTGLSRKAICSCWSMSCNC